MNSTLRGIAAGFIMFAASAYLLFAIPGLLVQAGVNQAAAFTMTVTTIGVGTLVMGLVARRAIVVGPSLTLIGFILAVPVGVFGLSFGQTLASAALAGAVLLLLSLSGLRGMVMSGLPDELKAGVTAGVGLLLVANGLERIGFLTSGGSPWSVGPLDEPRLWLSAAAVLLMLGLMVRGLRMAVLPVVILTLIAGLTLGFTNLVLTGHTFLAVPPSLEPLLLILDFTVLTTVPGLMASGAIFLFLSFESGAVITARRLSDDAGGGKAPVADSLIMTTAPLIGAPGAVALPHSSAGWLLGGDERIAAVVAAILFGLCAFSLPVVGQLQDYATAPAVIVAGLVLCTGIREIDFSDPGAVSAAFVAVLLPPLTGSFAAGFAVSAVLLFAIRLLSLDLPKLTPGLIVTALAGGAYLAY